MKKYILCLIMLLTLCSCGMDNKSNLDIDINSGISYDDKDNGISTRVDKFYYKDNNSTMNLIIKNNNDYDVYIGKYSILVYDKDDKLIGSFNPEFNEVLPSGKETNQMFSTEADYSDAYKLEYVFDDVKENTKE